eukprot:CAMPEP_0167804700 /NCGR_PEP_ID=MMETSP0111_2-20121227/20660_1 /TAXON_ID=91324 /ORGANISM="Lotharella globosa, Strain CCCM811" /LENGTH=39 /DNA_ID= /DNA_START= /DNA_END= /DNA_ORIENTATION=
MTTMTVRVVVVVVVVEVVFSSIIVPLPSWLKLASWGEGG